MDPLISRFFQVTDPQAHEFVYKLPSEWWSRFYEYEWTKNFIEADDTCLDAASGVVHPLQYYLADNCRSVYACDMDARVGSRQSIEQMSKDWQIDDIINKDKYYSSIHRSVCSLTDLPYDDAFFDKVYCISTLEHLRDRFNKFPILATQAKLLRPFLKADIFDTLQEFKRVLKRNGKIVLTFDYPRINLEYLSNMVAELDLKFCGPVDLTLPTDAVVNHKLGLYCFRAILTKR